MEEVAQVDACLSFQITPEERIEMNQTGGTQKPDFIVPVFGMNLGSMQFLGTAFFVEDEEHKPSQQTHRESHRWYGFAQMYAQGLGCHRKADCCCIYF